MLFRDQFLATKSNDD